MIKIGNIETKNKTFSAPIAGYSNLVYREIVMEHGAGFVCAEMVSDKALCYKNQNTYDMLEVSNKEHPMAMQLFGADIDSLVEAAKIIDEKCDCDVIDINMGCPVPKVTKTGAGSRLLCDPEQAYLKVKAIVDAVKKPVTVKIRLGWDASSINVVEIAKRMEKAGAKLIAVHARTRAQLYEGKADWSYIKKVKEAVTIPVIGNGDIKTPEDAKRMIDETNCDGVMIARGAIGNPWLFKQVNDYLEKGFYEIPTPLEKVEMCLEHARRLINYYQDEYKAMKEMRSLACFYIKGFDNAARVRGKIHTLTTYDLLKEVLYDCLNNNI